MNNSLIWEIELRRELMCWPRDEAIRNRIRFCLNRIRHHRKLEKENAIVPVMQNNFQAQRLENSSPQDCRGVRIHSLSGIGGERNNPASCRETRQSETKETTCTISWLRLIASVGTLAILAIIVLAAWIGMGWVVQQAAALLGLNLAWYVSSALVMFAGISWWAWLTRRDDK